MKDIKEILYGDTERFPTPELGAQLAAEIFRGDFFRKLIFAIPLLDFDVSNVFVVIPCFLMCFYSLCLSCTWFVYFPTHTISIFLMRISDQESRVFGRCKSPEAKSE